MNVIVRDFGGNVHLAADVILLKDAAEKLFISAIYISRIKIIHAAFHGVHDFSFALVEIKAGSFLRKPHTPETENGKILLSGLHSILRLTYFIGHFIDIFS